jgi:general secretion pathway protein F/type IV pilus assembly protein PilC
MPDYTYTALAMSGAKSTGTLSANTQAEVEAQLGAKGLFPVSIAEAKPGSTGSFGGLFSGVGGRALATFYGQLADLLHSGVPLLRSLELLEKQSVNKTLQATVRDVRMQVAEGTGLSEAMGRHPRVFNDLVVSMVRAGQEGGFLEDVLKRTATFVEHQEDMKSKVVGALAYPAFLALAGVSVLLMLVIFFVPKFKTLFTRLEEKGELPDLTKALLWSSGFLINWWWALIIVGGAAVVGFIFWSRTLSGRYTLDALRLRLPVFGNIFRSLALSRFCRILGTMLHNGIPLLKSLSIAKDSTGNKLLSDAIEKSAESITAGQKLADPLRRNKYFPPDVVEMIAIAEEANSLEKVLIDVADGLEKRTSRSMELMVKLLEPVMLLVMAVAVLLVVAGLLLPVFKMGSAVGK